MAEPESEIVASSPYWVEEWRDERHLMRQSLSIVLVCEPTVQLPTSQHLPERPLLGPL